MILKTSLFSLMCSPKFLSSRKEQEPNSTLKFVVLLTAHFLIRFFKQTALTHFGSYEPGSI